MSDQIPNDCQECGKHIDRDDYPHSYHEPDCGQEENGSCFCVGDVHEECCRVCAA